MRPWRCDTPAGSWERLRLGARSENVEDDVVDGKDTTSGEMALEQSVQNTASACGKMR